MIWISLGNFVLIAFISLAVSRLFVGAFKRNRARFTMLFMSLFTGLQVVSYAIVIPYVTQSMSRKAATEALMEVDVYRALVEDRPDLKETLIAAVAMAGQDSMDDRRYDATALESILLEIFPQYVRRASDEAVIAYVHDAVDLMKQLERANPEACWEWLFSSESIVDIEHSVANVRVREVVDAMG